jgi:hypothetical protein
MNLVAADVSPLHPLQWKRSEPTHVGCYTAPVPSGSKLRESSEIGVTSRTVFLKAFSVLCLAAPNNADPSRPPARADERSAPG